MAPFICEKTTDFLRSEDPDDALRLFSSENMSFIGAGINVASIS